MLQAMSVMIAAKLKGPGRRNIYSKTKLYREGLIKHRSPLLNSKLSVVLIYIDEDEFWQLVAFYFLANDTAIANGKEIATSQASFTENVLQMELETLKKENEELIVELEELKTRDTSAAGGDIVVCEVRMEQNNAPWSVITQRQ